MSSDYTLPPVEPRLFALLVQSPWTPPEFAMIEAWGHACADAGRAPLAEENARLLARIAELESLLSAVIADTAEELGCAHDNEAILVAANRLRAEVKDWHKLLDPVHLYVNLLQGKPAQLTKAQLAHLLGQDYTSILAEVEALRAYLSQCATAVGASAAPDCSAEFLACVPREVELVVDKLRADAKRHQEIRRGAKFSVIDWKGDDLRACTLDAAADAAIAARKGEGSEG